MQNFIQKKTKYQNQTCVNILCKQEEILSRQKKKKKNRERQKVGCWMVGKFFQHTSFLFFVPFSFHFGEIEFRWAWRENSRAPLFSPPLNQTPFPLIFSPIFHSLFSILPKIHPTKHTLGFIQRIMSLAASFEGTKPHALHLILSKMFFTKLSS